MNDVPCERTLTDDIEYQTYIERLKEICLDTIHENYLAEVLIPLLRSSCINGIKIVPVFDDRASGARPKTVTKTRKRMEIISAKTENGSTLFNLDQDKRYYKTRLITERPEEWGVLKNKIKSILLYLKQEE